MKNTTINKKIGTKIELEVTSLSDMYSKLIAHALENTKTKQEAADVLGIHLNTLDFRIKKFDIVWIRKNLQLVK